MLLREALDVGLGVAACFKVAMCMVKSVMQQDHRLVSYILCTALNSQCTKRLWTVSPAI